MNNLCVDVSRSKDFYKGKSIDFAGIWTPGTRYFNDEFVTNFVVCVERDFFGRVTSSALLACKRTHLSKYNQAADPTNNEPILEKTELGVVGIKPNDYWIYICGSLAGATGNSTIVVNSYPEALLQASTNTLGQIIFVKNPRSAYIVISENRIQPIVIGEEFNKLAESKVDAVEGKGLSTEDFTTEEKEKLKTVKENANENIIESISLNGSPLSVVNKNINLAITQDTYSIERVAATGNNLASYVLTKNGTKTGTTINIPKSSATYGGSIETVLRDDSPYIGARVGDKYLDLVVQDMTTVHFYIPLKEAVKNYRGDEYINVDPETESISLNIDKVKENVVASINWKGNTATGVVDVDENDFILEGNSLRVNFNSANNNGIKPENIGSGLTWANNKVDVKVKDNSSLNINDAGELHLVWAK